MTQEGFLALGANEMLNVPMFTKSCNNSLFDWSTASTANRDSHTVMTTQAIQLVHIVSCKPSSTFDLASCWVQLDTTTGAVEMISVINFTAETQRCTINKPMTLLAWILSDFRCFDACVASMAQCTIVIANETWVSKFLSAQLATEAFRMPTCLHGFDDTSNDNVSALVAERSVKNSKIPFTILATFEFVENSVLKRAEALSAPTSKKIYFSPLLINQMWVNLHKALNMPQLSVRVDDLLLSFKPLVATSAGHRFQAHVGVASNAKIRSDSY